MIRALLSGTEGTILKRRSRWTCWLLVWPSKVIGDCYSNPECDIIIVRTDHPRAWVAEEPWPEVFATSESPWPAREEKRWREVGDLALGYVGFKEREREQRGEKEKDKGRGERGEEKAARALLWGAVEKDGIAGKVEKRREKESPFPHGTTPLGTLETFPNLKICPLPKFYNFQNHPQM